MIKAVELTAVPRTVEWLDDSREFCGKVIPEGASAFVIATRRVQLEAAHGVEVERRAVGIAFSRTGFDSP